MSEIKLKKFSCDKEELKKAAINSLLCDSGELASLEFEFNGKNETICLFVSGEKRIVFNGECYRYVQDYPEELIKIIKSGKIDSSKDVEIHNNNWVELWWTEAGVSVSCDDTVVDGEFGNGTPEEAYKYLIEMSKEIYAPDDKDVIVSGSEKINFC